MNCSRFQDSITDYLDSALDSRARAEFATHRLRCRQCRELFSDVRAAVGALGSCAKDEREISAELESRILSATTAGEMLSCRAFDNLLERYFDGVILAPTFQTFQAHFEHCSKCRRLLAGIEDAIEMCREVKESEVEVPNSLYDRIAAATVGVKPEEPGRAAWLRRWQSAFQNLARRFWTPQWAAAALIFAASGLMIISRFGSVSGMASEASAHTERLMLEGREAINQTGLMAITGIQRVSDGVNSMLQDAREAKSKAKTPQSDPPPSPQPSAEPAPPPADHDADEQSHPPHPEKSRSSLSAHGERA